MLRLAQHSNERDDFMHENEVYLGDGLYASFDGYQFILRTQRINGEHYVALEPSVLHEFERFVKRIEAQLSPPPSDCVR